MKEILSQQSYKLLNLIGEGGSSQVYRALRSDSQSELQEIVAVKLLKSKKLVSAWKQEYETLRKAQSPYCVKALGFERINSYPAIIMDYIDGANLHELKKEKSLSFEEVQYITKEIEKAVRTLHSCGIIHGDLSPKNILINKEGQILLIDYGLQGHLGKKNFVTKEFAHPLVFENKLKLTKKTDEFSVQQIKNYLLQKTHSTKLQTSPKKEISEKITELIESRQLVSCTKVFVSERKKLLVKIAMMFFLATMIALPSQSSSHWNHFLKNKVSIRTHKAFKIYLNQKFIGYPPVYFYFTEKQVALTAVSKKNIYKRILTRSKNTHRVLNDDFFTQ